MRSSRLLFETESTCAIWRSPARTSRTPSSPSRRPIRRPNAKKEYPNDCLEWHLDPIQATAAYLRLEVPRTLRNGRLVVLTVVFPVVFYVLFTRVLTGGAALDSEARAFLMVSMAAYGAIGAALSTAVRVAMERTNGWTRQLRVTPLPPLGYVTTKLAIAYLTALPAILLAMVAGFLVNGVSLPDRPGSRCSSRSHGCPALRGPRGRDRLRIRREHGPAGLLGVVRGPVDPGWAVDADIAGPRRARYDRPDAAVVPLREPRLVGAGRPAPDLGDVIALVAYGAVFIGIVAWRYRAAEKNARG